MNFKTIKIILLLVTSFIYSISLPLSAQRRELERTVAKVNGEVILLSEFQERAQPVIEEYSKFLTGENMDENMDELKREILNRMIDEILLSKKAQEMEIEVTDADIDRGIDEIKQQFQSDVEFRDEMARQGFTEDTFRGDVEDQIKVIKLIEQEIQNKVKPPTEEEVREYYQKNKEQMVEPERVRARHILITTDERSQEEALQKINEIYSRVADDPNNFSELARELSEGPTAPYGGDLGYFSREEMVQSFADAAFELDVNQISKPVKTRFGYHIIKVIGRRAAEKKTFKEIKDYLTQQLYQLRMEEEYEEFLQQLRDESTIEITLFDN